MARPLLAEEDGAPTRLPVARQVDAPAPKQAWKVVGSSAALPCAGLGFGACLVAAQTPWTGRVMLAGVAAVVFSVLVAIGAVQTQRRTELLELLRHRLAPVTGPSQLLAKRWTVGDEPAPRRLRVTYSPGAHAANPSFEAQLLEVLEVATGRPYLIHQHKPRRQRIDLRMTAPQPDPEPVVDERTEEQRRAETQLERMLGPTCRITGSGLDEHGALAWVEGGHDIGEKLAAGGYRRRVEATFSHLQTGRWRAKWDMQRDTFRFEVRPSFPEIVEPEPISPTDEDPLVTYSSALFRVGVDEDGGLIAWSPKINPMGILVGRTGTGKTVAGRQLIMDVAAHGWMVWIVDGKGVEFLGLRDWPNVQIVANRVAEQISVIYQAKRLMDHRYDMVESGRASAKDFEPILLFIDEWADFRANLLGWYVEHKPPKGPAKPPVLEMVGSLLRKGRTARVHVLLGTQRADAEYFGGDQRDNLGFRMSMGRISAQSAQMMWDSPHVGISLPRSKRGRATAVNNAGDPVEIQTFFVPDPDDPDLSEEYAAVLARLRPPVARHDRLVVIPPETQEDIDGDETAPTYWDYLHADWARAVDRPDLDPLQQRTRSVDGRASSSPMAMLGLLPPVEDTPPAGSSGHNPEQPLSATDTGTSEVVAQDDEAAVTETTPAGGRHLRVVTEDEHPSGRPAVTADASPPQSGAAAPTVVGPPEPTGGQDDLDVLAGYEPPEDSPAAAVQPGWMLLESHQPEHWVIVEAAEEDFDDPDQVAVVWRDDEDDEGVLSIDRDEIVTVCRPEEDS